MVYDPCINRRIGGTLLCTLIGLATITMAQPAGGAPQITGLSDSTLPRNGRLLILGQNFGGGLVTVAPDGTVYASDLTKLYALTPDGDLLWVASGAGGRRPISVGGKIPAGAYAEARGREGEKALKRDGSTVELPAVNRKVPGSNPGPAV